MEQPSVVLKILIVMSSLLFLAKISYSTTVNYVKPFTSERASPCSDTQRPCLTLNEYASDLDQNFVNNTRFYFYPGIHRLDYSLILMNLYNFLLLGWPSGGQVVTIAVDSSATITWNETRTIEISSIRFALHGINFTFIMRFEHSQLVRLSNISIYGNGYRSGCSSIISEDSAIEFNDSTFIGINGFLGAAVLIFASNITFRGNIMFIGTSLFRNNTSLNSSQEVINGKMLSCNNISSKRKIKQWNYSGTGGGAMILSACSLNIRGNASFVGNKALYRGGAMLLQNTNSNVIGNLYLNKNLVHRGGALSIIEGNFIIKGYTLFDSNYGGAMYIIHANFISCGNVNSGTSNVSFDVGALHVPLYKAKTFDAECSTDNTLSFNNSITFLDNTARYGGGSIACENASTIIPL
jgi:predicted outer membrane repeat protein